MNLFFGCVTDDVSCGVLNRLIERYQPTLSYISYIPCDAFKDIKGKIGQAYYHNKICKGDYSNCVFEHDCPPLDTALLVSMAEYESEILKMIERFVTSRIPMDYDSRVRHYHRHLRYWNHLLDAAEIGVAVFLHLPHEVYDYIIYRLCQKKGIPVSFAYISPIREYMYFSKNIEEPCPELSAHYQRLTDEYRDKPIEKIELSPDFQRYFDRLSGNDNSEKTPVFMKPHSFSSRIVRTAERWSYYINHFIRYPNKLSRSGLPHIISSAIFKCKAIALQKYKSLRLIKAYDKLSVSPDFRQPYIYFPLHLQPECTTSPICGVFVHQLLIAQMLSFYLPKGVMLYIKEHPLQLKHLGSRRIQLYRDLAALPGVRLVNKSTDTYSLIENCIGVASGIGTAGIEGMFMGKPFLMFGNNSVKYAPGTFNIRNGEDCKKTLEAVCQGGPKHTLKDIKLYLKALSEITLHCSVDVANIPVSLEPEENSRRIELGLSGVIDEQLIAR